MEDITCQELKGRLENGETVNILDVREEWEHQENNIGGTLIPLNSIPHQIEELSQFKDQELIIYCQTGIRSANAKMFLAGRGFTGVRNLLGGIKEFQSL